ncbi:Hypothetical predicted protein [Olea europaea subsp. europaea]|uniref:Uncharacterized protein n=1 Tax=Olea europaea subsp. europaea TaxID=158383 RepID=A0A8S0TEE5_OLEEU|nr:Hypothetical predicted protein [Olea europaea subsp. europaea]
MDHAIDVNPAAVEHLPGNGGQEEVNEVAVPNGDGAVHGAGGEVVEALPVVAVEGEGAPAAGENGANAHQVEHPWSIHIWIIACLLLSIAFSILVTLACHKANKAVDSAIFLGTLGGSAIACIFIVPFVVRILLRARLKSRFVFLILIFIFHGWLVHIISDEKIMYDVSFDVGTLLVLVAIRVWSKDDEHHISSTIVLQLLSVGIETLHCNSDCNLVCKVFKEPKHAKNYKAKAGCMIATAILGSIVTICPRGNANLMDNLYHEFLPVDPASPLFNGWIPNWVPNLLQY